MSSKDALNNMGDRFSQVVGIDLGTGFFTKFGITWFAKQLYFAAQAKSSDNFLSMLENYEKEAELFLENSDLLRGYDLGDDSQIPAIIQVIKKDSHSSEYWAAMMLSFIYRARRSISQNDALSAAWATSMVVNARAMFLYRNHLEGAVWRGYTTKGLKTVLDVWNENKDNNDEEFWLKVLSDNSLVLSQLFSFPVVILGKRAYVGGKGVDNNDGKIVDFLVNNELAENCAIIEIKTPRTPLMGKKYRDIYPLSHDISGAISQVINYRDELVKNYHNIALNSKKSFFAFDPQCLVIAGRMAEDEKDIVRKKSFELLRRSLKDVQLVTYDELFRKVETLIVLLDR